MIQKLHLYINGYGKMKNDRLKPYVYKIEGVKNYAFFDILNGMFYQFKPSGTIKNVRKQLKEAGLIFSSKGVVPFKTRLNVIKKEENILIRNLQLCLNGIPQETCWSAADKDKVIKGKSISRNIVDRIIFQFTKIPINKLTIVAYSIEDKDKIKLDLLIKKIKFQALKFNVINQCNQDWMRVYANSYGIKIDKYFTNNDSIEEIIVDPQSFFYNQSFNPCLGHQISIDTDGNIKPCLWWPSNIGNICTNNLKDLIISGEFNKYWDHSKDHISECKNCEYRYNCYDCRINPITRKVDLNKKAFYCKYDPNTGIGCK
jgi:radical SAM protein with 4Fe4S-binding SPASM domain